MRTPSTFRSSLFALTVCLVGCSDEAKSPPAQGEPPYVPPPESCDSVNLDDPRTFRPCNMGSGIFGTWVVDDLGLPAYFYGLDQHADPRATFFNTEALDRRDHWSAIGNGRMNATVSNDGFVEVAIQDRGVTYLDKLDPEQGNWAGGYGWIDDGEATWATAYRFRPSGAKTTRTFGMGYAESTMDYREISVLRRTFAPPGDAPFVIDEVTLHNHGTSARTLRHYEFWDVGRRPIEINWIVSGMPFTNAPAQARMQRDARNDLFVERMAYDATTHLLSLSREHAPGTNALPPDAPNAVDEYPGDPFLVALVGDVNDVYTDQASFFGANGPAKPVAVVERLAGKGIAGGEVEPSASGKGQPRMMTLRSDVTLSPGEKKVLRFAYGVAPMGSSPTTLVDPMYRDAAHDFRADLATSLRKNMFYFAPEKDPVLHREMAWHAAQMEISVGYRDYWGVHVVPQGSAYLYLHGADGAARDLSLFAVPLVYTHPSLAKEEIALNMMITYAQDRRISYAFQGHGMLDDALELHKAPSDLTIFLLWAIAEYIGATGDVAFLDEPMPFYPKESVPGAIVWDHVKDAVRHLFDVIGTGEHGLIRVGTGDWSDGIVVEAPDRTVAVQKGESVPNTQMAVAVLPRVADLVESRDAALATEIRMKVDALRQAAKSTFGTEFFGRAYFGDGILHQADKINLESQVWALIGDTFPTPGDRAKLISAIARDLDDPSPAGAMLLPQGQVWPAITGLLTWGYAQTDSERAFAHLAKNTLAGHALAFPEIWYGIWTAPDGMLGPFGDRPGQSWYSQVTPMTDFPAMNNNQHAMPILAALRAAGIDATATGLRLTPPANRNLSLQTELVNLDLRPNRIAGAYRPLGGGTRTLDVVVPPGKTALSVRKNGTNVTLTPGTTTVSLTIDVPMKGAETTFEVTYGP